MADTGHMTLRNVMALAVADGKLTAEEKQFIQRLRKRLGVSDAEFAELVRQVRETPDAISLPSDPKEAEDMIRLLADAAAADGHVREQERTLLRRLGEEAGVPRRTLDSLLGGHPTTNPAEQTALNARMGEIYTHFNEWDDAQRRRKLTELGAIGPAGAASLLLMLESYRTPDGAENAMELKVLIVEQLGQLGDPRAVYYLAQHISFGDVEDEISNSALRHMAAEAIGRIIGRPFSRDQAGVLAAREWWRTDGRLEYETLAI